jgi:hypothetical protein
MRHTILKAVVTAVLLLPATARGADLDGTRWKMRFRSAKAWLHVWKGDLMLFEAGKFADRECDSYGFAQSPYGVQQRNGRRLWRATRFNPDGERVDWEGQVEGDRMTGSFTWSRPDGRSRTYKFKARRVDAEAASKG